jgi:hypothetical protein
VPSRPTLPSRTAPRRRPAPRRRAPHRGRPGPRLVPSVITNSNSRPPTPRRRRPVPNPRRSSAQGQVARRHRRSVPVPPARFGARPAPGRRRPPASPLPYKQHSREGRGRRPLRTSSSRIGADAAHARLRRTKQARSRRGPRTFPSSQAGHERTVRLLAHTPTPHGFSPWER